MIDDEVWAAMAARHGVIDRTTARAIGLSDRQIQRRVTRGEWIRVAPGVYRHLRIPQTWRGELVAACTVTGGLASHRSAAVLHELEGIRPGRRDITVAHGQWRHLVGTRVHMSTQLDRADATVVDGVPCTGLGRTVLDLSHMVSYRMLEDVVDALVRDRRLVLTDLHRTLTVHARRGRNGSASLRRFLDARIEENGVPLSAWSRAVADLFVAHGLPEPRLEFRIYDVGGMLIAQVDLAYPGSRVAIELDSVRWHLNRDSFVRDRRRWNALVTRGWTLLAFTWDDCQHRPLEMVDHVRAALSAN